MDRYIRLLALFMVLLSIVTLITYSVGIYVPSRYEVGLLIFDNVMAYLIIAIYATNARVTKPTEDDDTDVG